MTTKDEVESFLKDFKVKMGVLSIVFRDERGKNRNALLELGITPNDRNDYLQKLKAINYFKGPTENYENNIGALWGFGTDVNGSEVYVKITMGIKNKPVICISFHLAEYPIEYPFKK